MNELKLLLCALACLLVTESLFAKTYLFPSAEA